jgi:uncharacterized protein involved in cysteine biosynthesis
MEPHGSRSFALTLLLGLIVVYDVASAVFTTANAGALRQAMPQLPEWALWASVGAGLLRAVGAGALVAYRRWGFVVLCAGAAARAGLGFVFAGGFDAVYSAFMSVLVLAVVFGMLAKGGAESTWARLR